MKCVKVSILIFASFLAVSGSVLAEKDQWGDFGQKYQVVAGLNITQN